MDGVPTIRLGDLISRTQELVRAGRHTEAYVALSRVLEAYPGEPEPGFELFMVHRLLGQCLRCLRQFDLARVHYYAAYEIGVTLNDAGKKSAAVEGLALVECDDRNPNEAMRLFEEAIDMERCEGDGPGLAAVLQNYAQLLADMDDPRAE